MVERLDRDLDRGLGRQRGAALVEFALVSLVLYLILAGVVEFGRVMFDANALNEVARVAARELSVAPVRADATFDYALSCNPDDDAGCFVNLRQRIFDPACLVVDLSDPAIEPDPDGYFAAMPVVNRSLRQLLIADPAQPNILRYPGAVIEDGTGAACSAVGPNGQAAATGLTVAIPVVTSRDGSGVESISWVPVLQEIRGTDDADCPLRGPFSLVYLAAQDACGPLAADPLDDRGLAAVRVNYPYQAAMLSGFRPVIDDSGAPLGPNVGNAITADDGGVQENNLPSGAPIEIGGPIGPYAGPYGLGRQYALAGRVVRPFRKLISAQAIYRREVVE